MTKLQSAGTVIELSKSEAELIEEFDALLTKEGRYFDFSMDEHDEPLQCRLKWDKGHKLCGGAASSCYTCPARTSDPQRPLMLLCALGRRQEDVLDQIVAARTASSLDAELAAALADEIESCAELAGAFA